MPHKRFFDKEKFFEGLRTTLEPPRPVSRFSGLTESIKNRLKNRRPRGNKAPSTQIKR